MADNKLSAEEILRKNKSEMSEIERMMAGILEAREEPALPKKPESPVPVSPEPPVKVERAPKMSDRDGIPKPERVTETTVSGFNEIPEPPEPDIAYSSSMKAERERKIAAEVRRRKTRPALIILIVCAFIVVGAILFNALRDDLPASFEGIINTRTDVDNPAIEPTPEVPEATLPPDIVIPTPEAEEAVNAGTIKVEEPGGIIIMSGTEDQQQGQSPEQATPVGTYYQLFIEDVSWQEARQRCLDKGGWLATVSNEDELEDVIMIAAEGGVDKVWLGCHRENNVLVWENNEQIDFYNWGNGEPSYVDSGDNVTEDCLLLWRFNNKWVYNDSRNNPVADYPAMYSGQIGYICEFPNS